DTGALEPASSRHEVFVIAQAAVCPNRGVLDAEIPEEREVGVIEAGRKPVTHSHTVGNRRKFGGADGRDQRQRRRRPDKFSSIHIKLSLAVCVRRSNCRRQTGRHGGIESAVYYGHRARWPSRLTWSSAIPRTIATRGKARSAAFPPRPSKTI